MRTFTAAERASTLEVHTYACAIRGALRRGRVFLPGSRLIGLRLPPDAAMDVYKDAVDIVLKSVNLGAYVTAAVTVSSRTGETDADDVLSLAKHRAAIVVLIQDGAVLPAELMVVLDDIVDVAPVNARHLVAAAKSSAAMELPLETARKLAGFPMGMVFLALRPGRPLDAVLKKLEAGVSVQKRLSWEPRVEELEGYGKAKDWALDLVEDFKDLREGRIAWEDVASGLLLSGPPGTGKTLFASAVARSCGARFFATSSAQWQAKGHLGDMLGAMRKSFRDAANNAPAVLFIDEFDAIGDRRSFSGNNKDYCTQVVNALLELLDGSGGREGVVVIAASNLPDHIDPALRRPGRLDRHFEVELPDRIAREKMLATHLGSAAPAASLSKIAAATSGYSGAELAQVAKDARRIARRHGRNVEISDLLELVPPVAPVESDEQWSACIHEAGHAVVGLELGVGSVEMIVVARETGHRDGSFGHVVWMRNARRTRTRSSYLAEIAMLLAGMAAEEIILGDVFDGSGGGTGSDLQRASDIATLMLANLGLGSLQYSDVTKSEELDELRRSDPVLRRRVERLLEGEFARGQEIVKRHRTDTERIAQALSECGALAGSDLLTILRRGEHVQKINT